MRRSRHALTAFVAALPVLIVALVVLSVRGSVSPAAVTLLWLAAVAAAELALWIKIGQPARAMTAALDCAAMREGPRLVRELHDEAARHRDEKERLARRLEDLSSSLGDGLLVVTSDLRLRLINRPALDFCGADRAERGSHLLEILRDPVVIEVVEEAAAGGSPEAEVVENRSGLWEIRAFPVRDGGAVVLLAEVSLVRRSAEFRRRFVQDLSHELRSPLAVLRTTVEALEEDIDSRLAEVLIRQVERLDRLTRELYDLANIESGQMELELEEVALAPLIQDVVDDFEPEATSAGIELRREGQENAVAWCDRRGLYRVLSNLIDNAIKYNRRGGWVEVWAAMEGNVATLRISDSGEGIPPGELRAVLQRFYRVDRARTPGRGGLGLGLAIVKHMVQRMGGRLDLRSREGVGTTVTITLPAAPLA